jgi:tetratricopeptide (TPR) repeat protein
MRATAALFLLLTSVATLNTAEPTLSDAQSRWLRGNYEEARVLYEKLAPDPKNFVTAEIGISRCLESQGQYDKALNVLDNALASHSNESELLARRAELLYFRGRWDDADRAAEKALAAQPGHFLARWIRSQVDRDRGNWQKADGELRWFVRAYSERSGRKNEIKDPDELVLVGLAGAENARWHKLADQFQIVLNDVYGAAIRNDKDYWPAEYQAGMLLLEKYNQPQALEAFDKALVINPNAALAFVGKGVAALQKYEARSAELFANRAIRINPNLPDAHRLLADVYLLGGDIAAARRELDEARKINPRDETTLGRYAACLHLAHQEKAFDSLVTDVTHQTPKPAVFYYTLGEALEARKHYDRAEQCYRKAMELQPWLPWPQNSLGLLYMRLGQEKAAYEVLSKAIDADEFNVRVSNSLRVLQHLERYATTRSEHFDVRYDPQNDERLAHYMLPYLEEIYAQLAKKFGYRPPDRILIEVFNNHEMFSGRLVALPDLHTIGASTGRIVALVSPNGRDIRRPFNWARVLRHELVHVFNLEQTRFLSPHWLTEGLAVIQEGNPRPQLWNELLAERVPDGPVMTLDNIDLGFIRPRSQLDWHMAYCQSQLYVEYMTKEYGAGAIGEMLAAYRDGLDTSAAISRACHLDKLAFEKGYREYLIRAAQEVQFGTGDKPMTYRQLQRAYESNSHDIDLAARLAEQYLIRGDKKEARRLADMVLEKNAKHPLAAYVKAQLLLEAGDDGAARALLENAQNRPTPNSKVLQALAKLYYESRDFDKAAALYEEGRRAHPYDTRWLTHLLRAYTQAGHKEKQIEVLKLLVPTDPDDLDMRKRLAQMLSESADFAGAERYAREALEIDVRDVAAREILVKSLEAQHKKRDAEHIRALLGRS